MYKVLVKGEVYTGEGTLMNSNSFNGLPSKEAKEKIIETFGGKKVTRYKLQDWVFSRQRYWGEPIPMVHDEMGKSWPLDVSELPLILPQVEHYEPTGTGESPLANIKDWVEVYGYLNDKNEFRVIESFQSKEAKTFYGEGSSKIKDNLPVTKRKVVDVILRDKESNFYLLKDSLGYKFIGGGIEEGENEINAVIRETVEESGFLDFKVTKKIEQEIIWEGYHEIKDINVNCRGFAYEVVLNSDKKTTSEIDQKLHELVKVSKEEVSEFLFWDNHKLFFQEYLKDRSTNIKKFTRETNTMPQWAGSSWYYLRFADTENSKELISQENEKYWQPVDRYVGGAEHATRHLIYARFWHKFLYDIGVVTHVEPFLTMESVGLVLGPDGQKMSKRRGNVINPDDVVKEWGADTVRLYTAFMGSFYDVTPWNSNAIVGCARFLEKVWRADTYVQEQDVTSVELLLHKTIKKVTEDIETFKFNTAISSLMIFLNKVEEGKVIGRSQWNTFIQILTPFAPFLAEELLTSRGQANNLHTSGWPTYDIAKTIDSEVTMSLQVNGKLRGTFTSVYNATNEEVKTVVFGTKEYQKYVGDVKIKKVIIIKNRLVNIVI